jgi:hypothetical protein
LLCSVCGGELCGEEFGCAGQAQVQLGEGAYMHFAAAQVKVQSVTALAAGIP